MKPRVNKSYWVPGVRARIARAVGIPPSNLSEILHRKRGVSFAMAAKLAGATKEEAGRSVPWMEWLQNKTSTHRAFFGKPQTK